MPEKSEDVVIKENAWKEAFYCYATAYIYEKRATKFLNYIRYTQFLGIAVPSSVGFLVLSGTQVSELGKYIAGILALFQLLLTIASINWKWDETYALSIQYSNNNKRISNKFQEIAENPIKDFNTFKHKFDLLIVENNSQSENDEKQLFSDLEKRIGHRAALRNFQKPCLGCNTIPKSMTSTQCDTCGNF